MSIGANIGLGALYLLNRYPNAHLISENVDLLKLDIEGFEYDVLEKAEINAQKDSSLIIEFHDCEKNGQKCAVILNRLVNERGYRLADAHGKAMDIPTFCQCPGATLAKLTA